MRLFTELTFTNNTKALKVSDNVLSIAWANLCERYSKKLSVDAIRLICNLSYDFSTDVSCVSSGVIYQLEDPFLLASDAAVLFPEDYPSWEREDSTLCERARDGGLILSLDGFALSSKIKKEVTRIYSIELSKLKSNSYIHPLIF